MDGKEHIVIEFFYSTIGQKLATEPDMTSGMVSATSCLNTCFCFFAQSVIACNVQNRDAEEYVIIYPLGNGIKAFESHYLDSCISNVTVSACIR